MSEQIENAEVTAIEAAYVLGVTPARIYKIRIKTIGDLIKEIKYRQMENLPLYSAMWKRLSHVRAMAAAGPQAVTQQEQIESVAWSLGWCGNGDVKTWAEARSKELENLFDLINQADS